MNHITEATQKSTYAVIANYDQFGTGYLVQNVAYVAAAVADGWQVLVSGVSLEIANRIAETYRNAGKVTELTATPVLSDLLTYNFTEAQEDRSGFAQEFDIVRVPYAGMWLEGVITEVTEDYIEIDGVWCVEIEVANAYGELVAKADDDCGFIKSYGQWLDKLQANQERIYAIASEVESSLAA